MAGRRRTLLVALIAALVGTLVSPVADRGAAAAAAPGGEAPQPEVAPGRVLVTLAPGVRAASLDRALQARGVRLRSVVGDTGIAVVDTGGRSVETVVAELRGQPGVTSASPDHVRRATGTPDEPLYTSLQRRHAGLVRLPAAWDRTTGSRDAVVAVLDTGIHFRHPDLLGKVLPGWDAVDDDAAPVDDNGHGTFVAGIAAARSANGEGIAGVASSSPILPVRVLDEDGAGTDADIIEGIVWAADHGADVINLSLSGPGRSPALDAAVRYALDRNAVVVAATGDSGAEAPEYPAASPGAVGVGATDAEGRLAHFSNWGDAVDLVAPGLDVASTVAGGGYATGHGTSFAAPFVAGVAALVRSWEPGLPGRDVANRVMVTSKDIGAQGRDPQTGRGVVDAAAAVGAKPRAGVAVPRTEAGDPPSHPKATTAAHDPLALHTIAPEGDVDWYHVDYPDAPPTVRFRVRPSPPAAGDPPALVLDPVLSVYGPAMQLLGTADEAGPGGEEVVEVPTEGQGRYRFEVRNRLPSSSPNHYTVEVVAGAGAEPPGPVFEPAEHHATPGGNPGSVAIGDVTGDGREDVLATQAYPHGSATLWVFRQGTDGALEPPVAHGTNGESSGVATGDIDGDGDADAVVAAGAGLDVFLQGPAGLGPPTHVALGEPVYPPAMDVGDVDGDGDGDVATVNGDRLVLTRRSATGFTVGTLEQGSEMTDVDVADLDGDGADEVVRLGCEPPGACNAVAVHRRRSGGGFTRTVSHARYRGTEEQGLVVADLTGDGRNDVAASFGGTEATSRIEVFPTTSTGVLGTPQVHGVTWRNPAALEAGDVDADGDADLVTVHSGGSAGVLRQADGQLAAEEAFRLGSFQPAAGSLAVGDVTGDGRDDAVAVGIGITVLEQRTTTSPPPLPDVWLHGPSPTDMAVGVVPARIDVQSTRPLEAASVRPGATVRLVGGITGRDVPASVTWDAEFRTIRITPAAPLRRGLPYVVRIRGIRDLRGGTMEELFRSRFTIAT